MKTFKPLMLASVVAASAIAAPAQAEVSDRSGAIIFSSSVIGAIAGGPAGMLIGMFGGGFVGSQLDQQDMVAEHEQAMASTQLVIEQLELALAESDRAWVRPLEMAVLFRTGESELTDQGRAQLGVLGSFLRANPELSIELSGHTDPRGSDARNQQLSEARALAVRDTLIAEAVDPARLVVSAMGATASTATEGDLDAYAMERVVQIRLSAQPLDAVAQHRP